MDQFILVWQDGSMNVLCGDKFLHSSEKPALSFQFDMLVAESPTGIFFKTIGNVQTILSENEIAECEAYCNSFLKNGEYNVFAYDPNDGNMFVGEMPRSEAETVGFEWVLDSAPESGVASWDKKSERWVNYVAALTENGHLIPTPDSNHRTFVQYLTEEELNNFPKPERDSDQWDFALEKWVDKRDIERVRKEAILDLRNSFDAMRWREAGGFVTAYEQGTWRDQIEEAKSWLADNSVDTPYIDAFLAHRDDAEIPAKGELCYDILANHKTYIEAQAKVSARIWHYKKLLDVAVSCSEIDAIRTDYTNELKTYLKGTK